MRALRAHAVSAAVHQRLPCEPAAATVLLRTSGAVHVDAGGFVIAIADRRSPFAPNAIVVPTLLSGPGLPAPGDPAAVSAGRVRAGGLLVTWDPHAAPLWEPRVPSPPALDRRDVAGWAATVLRVLARQAEFAAERSPPGGLTGNGELATERTPSRARALAPGGALTAEGAAARLFGASDLDARTGLTELLGSVRRRDPGSARGAARLLTGRGPGLTPAGDDLIAGAAATVATLGGALGFGPERRRAWHRAAVLPDLPDRTTAVSATLLRLAAGGAAAEPLHGLLHGAGDPERGLRALRRLLGIGHTTGWATAAAAGLCMSELAAAAAASSTRKECA